MHRRVVTNKKRNLSNNEAQDVKPEKYSSTHQSSLYLKDYSVASFLNISQNTIEAWNKARGLRDKAELPESLLSPRAQTSALTVGFREDCLNIAWKPDV